MPDAEKTAARSLSELQARIASLENQLAEQRRQIESLAESEAKWRSVAANAALFILVVDRDAIIQFINQAPEGMIVEEIVGSSVYQYVSDPYHDETRRRFDAVFQTGEPQFFEVEGTGHNGRDSWYEIYVGPVTVGGQIVAATLTAIDVTERKESRQATMAAKEAAERDRIVLQAAIDSLPFDFFGLDLTNRYILQNRISKLHWGDGIGKTPQEICPNPDDLALWLATNRRAFAGEWVEGDVSMTFRGEKRYYHHVVVPICIGEATIGILGVNIDTTERHLAEEALRRSEAKYRLLYQSLMDAFVSVNLDGYIWEFNESYRAMLGYEAEELLKLRYTDITPEKWHGFQAQIIENQVLRQGYSQIYEKEYRRKDGSVFPVELRTYLLRDERGQPQAMWAIIRDISERKRAEAALQKAHEDLERLVEERTGELVAANEELAIFRLFAEAATQGFGIAELDGRIRYLNPAMCRIVGENSVQEAIGRSFFEYGRSIEYMKDDLFPKMLDAGRWEREGLIYTRQGRTVPVWHNTFIIRDENGQPAYIAATISDITERKQAEEALQQSLHELKTLYEGMSDGLLIADLETRKIYRTNPALRKMLGYNETEAESLCIDDIHPPEEWPAIWERFEQRLAGRQIPLLLTSIRRKDGTIVPVEITSNNLTYAGRPCVTGFFRDITERKKAQESLQREHRTLKHLLQSSDHERQTIAYEIHDGLAQYLASAIMQFQTYYGLKDAKPDSAKRSYDAAMTLLEQGHAESRRLISGVRPPVLDEAGVVEAIAHLINEQNRNAGPRIEFLSIIHFSRLAAILENAIYRIIQEAMTNACRYSQSDRVRITLLQQKDRLRIEIRDWGRGFDPKSVQEGSYGLAGIRERARLLGGKFRLQSAAGKGTRIVVRLPLSEREK